MVPVSAQPSGSSTTPVPAPKEEKATKEIVLGLSASSAAPLTKSRKRTGAATETIKKRRCTAGAEGEPSGPLLQHRAKCWKDRNFKRVATSHSARSVLGEFWTAVLAVCQIVGLAIYMVPKVGYHSYTDDTGVEAGIRSSSQGEPTRVTAELAGEYNHTTVQLAGELNRVIVQLSGEWLLCGIRSFVHFRSFFQ
ncbi:hypothetical protein HID58_043054 [Brassica napus]|uniref:Uncharacterized protein n=1 Tax=Brassica napus TaxID=3708 RepID=A0ABQ8BFG2_BRANA|nr:hypothetical protein HID58_043054 [Brassica napus]